MCRMCEFRIPEFRIPECITGDARSVARSVARSMGPPLCVLCGLCSAGRRVRAEGRGTRAEAARGSRFGVRRRRRQAGVLGDGRRERFHGRAWLWSGDTGLSWERRQQRRRRERSLRKARFYFFLRSRGPLKCRPALETRRWAAETVVDVTYRRLLHTSPPDRA